MFTSLGNVKTYPDNDVTQEHLYFRRKMGALECCASIALLYSKFQCNLWLKKWMYGSTTDDVERGGVGGGPWGGSRKTMNETCELRCCTVEGTVADRCPRPKLINWKLALVPP